MPSVVLSSPVHGLPHSLSGYTPTYSRVSSFRSPQLEVLLYSPHVTTETTTWATNRTIPIYGDHDTVTGKIIIDPSCRSGRIYLTLTGTFSVRQKSMSDVASPPEHIRHIFFHAARTIEVADSDLASPSSLRSVFRRKSRTSTAEFETRTFPFAFDLGESHTGKILPSTFSSSGTTSMPVELAYQLVVAWEPARLTYKTSITQIPIIIQPDPDFHSLDASPGGKQESWLEIPLKSQRPVPVRCAITLPSTLTFSRASSIPFFVVFTTTPRSPALAREIATDATISIAVTSQFFWKDESATQPSMIDSTASVQSGDSRSSRMKSKVVKRMRSATTFWASRSSVDLDYDASVGTNSLTSSVVSDPAPRRRRQWQSNSRPPPVPPKDPPTTPPAVPTYSDTQLVHQTMSIGFPKRPRHGVDGKGHPSLEAHRILPDGLFKDKITLNRDMLPSINWAGISLKYFLDVSVAVGTDEFKARVLLRIK